MIKARINYHLQSATGEVLMEKYVKLVCVPTPGMELEVECVDHWAEVHRVLLPLDKDYVEVYLKTHRSRSKRFLQQAVDALKNRGWKEA